MMPEALEVGEQFVSAEYGPLTIVDTVRWAGVQENPELVHFDREFVRQSSRLRTFIASGAYRQAMLARALTERIGPRGRLLRLQVRHVAPTFEGDMLRYTARITGKSRQTSFVAITCEVEGRNQNGEQILTGSCTLAMP